MAQQEPRKRRDTIDELKGTLYSREHAPEIDPQARTPLERPAKERPPVAWQDGRIPPREIDVSMPSATQPMKKKHLSLATKFFIGSLIFFIGATAAAAYLFFYGGNTISPQNIDIQIVAPSIIDGGKESTFQIIIDNRNQSPLQLVDLAIDYPDGTRDPQDQSQPLTHERQSIGTIEPGQQIKRTANAVFYGSEGSQQKVMVTLSYSVPGSTSVFEKQAEADFTIGSSPVSISVNAPAEAIAGQQFGIDVTVTSNSTSPIDNVVLQGQYPFGFLVVQTSPSADTGGTIWRLGTLAPGESQAVHLTGTIDGQDGDERVFRFLTGIISDPTDTQITVPFITVPQTLTVHRPFVSATIALGGKSGKSVAIPGAQVVDGTITWQNNLSVPVSNLELHLTLSGPMLDPSSVQSGSGFYQSQNSTIVWSKDQDSTLAAVPPGGSGTEQFSFSTLAPGTGGTVYTNPTIDLNVGVSGVREGETGVPETVSSAATLQASIASALTLDVQALHFSGPFQNGGSMPPRAEQTTAYTIQWTVKNSANAVANATVAATLPPYVEFVSAGQNNSVTYDSGSRTVTWDLGDLNAGVGYSTPARVAAFQVALTPSTSQVGGTPTLTSDAQLQGEDRFAQVGVQATAQAPNTVLQGDTGFTSGMAQVAPK